MAVNDFRHIEFFFYFFLAKTMDQLEMTDELDGVKVSIARGASEPSPRRPHHDDFDNDFDREDSWVLTLVTWKYLEDNERNWEVKIVSPRHAPDELR